jgi:protease-4
MFAFFTVMNLRSGNSESTIGTVGKGQIGVIEVEGVILKSKPVIDLLLMAEEDKKIDAIILRINSPGGAVSPTQEIYEEIRRIDAKKPVYASFDTVAASGGYYLGAATRRIYANPGTLTGSIGVIMQFANLEKVFEFFKIQQEIIKAGKFKDIGSTARKMTEEERTFLNSMVQGVHKQFINDIMKNRKDKLKKDISELAQGQIFNGDEAHSLGLVDELGSLWFAGRKIHEELKLKGDFGLKFIKEEKDVGFVDILRKMDNSASYLSDVFNSYLGLFSVYKP